MKKYILSIAACALALSCTKENIVENELSLGEGFPVTVEIGAPDNGDSDDLVTKITESTEDGKTHKFTWNKGDAFRMVFWKEETAAGQSTLMDAGVFTTEEGGVTATFKGTIPPADEGEYNVWALSPASAFTERTTIDEKSSSEPNKFYIRNINLPASQDGTGFKYCCFAAKDGKITNAGGEWSFTKNPQFVMSNSILHLKVNPRLSINKISVTHCRPDYQTSPGASVLSLAGETLSYHTSATSDASSGGQSTVTVYNKGLVLDDVYIAVRHISNDVQYGISHLKFAFYSTDGSVAYKTLKLAEYDNDGNILKYNALSTGKVYNLGTINSLENVKEKKISWIGIDKTCTIFGPEGASYAGFPWANNSSAESVTQITDGKDGAVLVNGPRFTEERAYEFRYGISGENRNILTVGANTDNPKSYYYWHNSYSRIRISYGYIEIPAIPGYKLTHISVSSINSADADLYTISSDKQGSESKALSGFYRRRLSALTSIDDDVIDAEPNTTYYQYIDGDRCISEFKYTYTEVKDTPARVVPEGTVDLGLSVFWATCNLGAASPENDGDYYAWGATETRYSSISGDKAIIKEGHKTKSYEDYKYCIITPGEAGQPADTTWTKYNETDGKKQLDPEDDAATQILGNGWRIPTHDEWTELRNHTRTVEVTDTDGNVTGAYLYSTVEGYEDKYIFIPYPKYMANDTIYSDFDIAGMWSSTCIDPWTSTLKRYAYSELPFGVSHNSRFWNAHQRPWSRNIRPVHDIR